MACSQEKRNFIITLMDGVTMEWGQCIVQSECSCDMQQWATDLARRGELVAHNGGAAVKMTQPVVMLVEDRGKVPTLLP